MEKFLNSPWFWNPVLLIVIALINFQILNGAGPSAFQRIGSIWICFAILIAARYIKKFNYQMSQLDKFDALGEVSGASSVLTDLPNTATKLKLQLRGELSSLVFLEAALLCLGSLQTGYGDLFHCWFNGNGWQTC